MNGGRLLHIESNSTEVSSYGMASAVSDRRRRTRPDLLLPGNRTFPDQDPDNLWSPDSSSSDENNSPTALNSFNWDKPALEDKSVDFGWATSQQRNCVNGKAIHTKTKRKHKDTSPNKTAVSYVNLQETDNKLSVKCSTKDLSNSPKKIFELTQSCGSLTNSSKLESIYPSTNKIIESSETRTACDSPISSDDLVNERTEEQIEREKEELRNVAWFQAGIPREIALEVLSEKPEGSFIVRESTTKPDCYALSLRVPQTKNPSGIAHYLILRTDKGYKIKGFTKEFSSLTALITHHSVMPELLPCVLDLSRPSVRDAEEEFEETEQKTCDIFSDMHWLMTDLEV